MTVLKNKCFSFCAKKGDLYFDTTFHALLFSGSLMLIALLVLNLEINVKSSKTITPLMLNILLTWFVLFWDNSPLESFVVLFISVKNIVQGSCTVL